MVMNRIRSTPTALRRQKQIEDCLYENLLHTPYQSISVADICRQVGISRKAYYNYYHDKDDCFCAIIDRLLRESMIHVTTSLPDNASPLETSIKMLEYWKAQRDFFDICVRNNLLHFILMRNMEYVQTEDRTTLDLLNTEDVKSDSDILACYTSVQLTLVLQWYFRGFDTPIEEMAKKLLRILHTPMILPAEV